MSGSLSPDIPANSTPAGRCQHVLAPPRRRSWSRDDLDLFRAAPDGERRYELNGVRHHSRDASVCDQP